MALDPKGLYSEGWWNENTPTLPPGVTPPAGVDWASGNYYAHFRINKDGSREIQWYQRGVGGGPGKPDPVLETTTDQMPAGSEVVKAWEAAQAKERAEGRAGDQEGDTRGPQNGPQREVYRNGKWVTENNPLYQTNQTGTTGSNPHVPAGSVSAIEGTPIGPLDARGNPVGGQYDNSQPIRAWHNPDGSIYTREPLQSTDADYVQWQRNKNNGKTDAEVQQAQQDKVGKPTGNTRTKAANGTTTKESEYLLPDGSTVWRTQTETEQPDLVGKPTGNTRERTENGQTIKESEYVLPNGTREWRTQSTQVPERGNVPPDLAGWRPDRTQAGWGLFTRRDQLDAAVAKGLITPQKRDEILKGDMELANSEASRVTADAANATRVYQEEVTQRNADVQANSGRLSNATSAFQTAVSQAGTLNQHVAPGQQAGGRYTLGLLGLQSLNAGASGGNAQVPRVTPPAALQPSGASPLAPPAPTGVATLATPPTASGVSATGALAPVAAGVTATNAAAINPSGANVQAANDATMQGSQAAFGALGVPAAAPAAPSGTGPTFGGPNGGFMPPAQTAAPDAPASIFDRGVPPVGMQNGWDPTGEVAKLRAEGFPDDVIHMALQGIGHPGLMGAM